ncbi:MAG: hypothetical protein MUO68_24295 [Desulfobacteraceae bacterium]|jgi:hypothetical protein|nr:hypothetical protein [Desulfobacteraceae bacterium]
MRLRQKALLTCILCMALIPPFVAGCAGVSKEGTAIKRIDPEEARAKVQAGKALLVCSYDDGKCKVMLLEGAMLRSTFESKVSSLSMDQEIIFYCN